MSKQIRKVLALLLSCAMVVTSFTFIGTNNLKAADEEAADQQIEQIDETADAEAEQVEAEDLETTEETLDIAEEGDGTSDGEEATSEQAGDAEKAAEEAKAEEEKKEEVSRPAQTLRETAEDGAQIVVHAPEGSIPEGSTVRVKIVNANSVRDLIEEQAGEIDSLAAYDITIHDADGKEIQPEKPVSVQIKNADIDGKATAVFHVDDDKTLAEPVEASTLGDNASFDAEHFSIYVVVNGVPSRATYTFKVGDTEFNKQVIKNGEVVADPGTPEAPEGKVFVGWFHAGTQFTSFNTPMTVGTTGEITLTAQFRDAIYVYFMTGVGDDARVACTKEYKPGDPAVTFDNVDLPMTADQRLVGWYYDKTFDTPVTGTSITPTADTTLYPYIAKGFWLTFNTTLVTGEGDKAETLQGSYIEPMFVTDASIKPEIDPTLSGYEFLGWYKDAACTEGNEFKFGSALTADTEIFAKWGPSGATADYTVIHWQENAYNEEYSKYSTETLNGKVGTETKAVVIDVEKNTDFDGFEPGAVTQEIIQDDGSTVVNIYYDRMEFTLTFQGRNAKQPTCGFAVHHHVFCSYHYWSHWCHGYKCYNNCYNKYSCYDKHGHIRCLHKHHVHHKKCYPTTDSDVYVITAKYGAPIAQYFNNDFFTKTYGGIAWMATNGEYDYALQTLDVMPNMNVTFKLYNGGRPSSSTKKTIYYWGSVLPGETPTKKVNGNGYKLIKKVDTYFNYMTFEEEFHDVLGFTRNTTDSCFKGGSKDFTCREGHLYYTRNEYTITYRNGAATYQTDTYKYGQKITKAADPTTKPAGVDQNAVFAGWYSNDEFDGNPFDFTQSMPAKNIVLYAKWEQVSSDVYVKTNDTNVTDKSGYAFMEEVKYAKTITQSLLPAQTALNIPAGKVFVGWGRLNADNEVVLFNLNTKIYQDTYLVPMFAASNAAYFVEYTCGNTTVKLLNDHGYLLGAKAEVSDWAHCAAQGLVAPEGKVFAGWKIGSQFFLPGSSFVVSDYAVDKSGQKVALLEAVFKDKKTTTSITYMPGDGATGTAKTYDGIALNETLQLKSAEELGFSKTNYTFAGWSYVDPETGKTVTVPENAEVFVDENNADTENIFTAVWTNNKANYTVKGYYEKASGSGYNTVTIATREGGVGTTVTVENDDKTPSDADYDYDASSSVTSGEVLEDGSLELKVYFKKARANYTVKGYYENAAGTGYDTVTIATRNAAIGAGVAVITDDKAPADGFLLDDEKTDNYSGTVTKDGKLELKVYFMKKAGSYAVAQYYEKADEDGYTKVDLGRRDGEVKQNVSVTNDDKKPAADKKGYALDDANTNKKYSGTVTKDGSLELKVYFKIATASYTVKAHYYTENGYTTVTRDAVESPVGTEITLVDADKAPDQGYANYEFDAANKENKLSGKVAKNGLVLHVYFKYKKASDVFKIVPNNGGGTYNGSEYVAGAAALESKVEGISVPEGATIQYSVYKEGEETPTWIDAKDIASIKALNVDDSKIIKIRAQVPGYSGYVTGEQTLTVTPVDLTVTADDASKPFGKDDPEFTYKITSGALIEGDELDVSLSRTGAEARGTYAIIPTVDTTKNHGNYNVTCVNGEFTIGYGTDLDLDVSKAAYNDVYNGKYVGGAASSDTPGTTIKYSLKENSTNEADWKDVPYTRKDVGTTTVYVRATNPDYEPVTASYDIVVTKKAVTLTSATLERPFNGSPLVNGDTALAVNDGWVDGEGLDLEKLNFTGSQTYVGSSANSFTYDVNKDTDVDNYTISVTFGVLNVKQRGSQYAITVTGKTREYTYDGKVKEVTQPETLEFTVENHKYKVVDGVTVTPVKEKNVGVYTTEVSIGKDVKVVDAANVDVTAQFIVKSLNGKVTIKKKDVYLESGSFTKAYDGTPLTNKDENGEERALARNEGWAAGEGATFTFTGAAKVVNKPVNNSFTFTPNEGTLLTNYTIHKTEGTLSLTKPSDENKLKITVTAKSDSVEYDGSAKTVSGFEKDSYVVNGHTYTVEGLTATVTATDAGTYTNSITGTAIVKDADNEDVTENFDITFVNGSLDISPMAISTESPTLTKEYDGDPLVCATLETTSENQLPTGSKISFMASQKLPGETQNYYEIDLPEGVNPDNYSISCSYGKLIVTNRTNPFEITVKSNSATATYDEQPHKAEGFETLTFKANNHDFTVSGLTASVEKIEAGEYDNEITGTAVVLDDEGDNVTAQFDVELVEGKLIINQNNGLELNTSSVAYNGPYDGQVHGGAVSVNIEEGTTIKYSTDGENWSEKAPTLTDVGTLNVSVKAENNNYDTVETSYIINVYPRQVRLKSADLTQVATGDAKKDVLTNGDTPLAVNHGWVDGEGIHKPSFTGVQEGVGSSSNTFEYRLKHNTKPENYNISVEYGCLSITKKGAKYELTVVANSYTVTYDGQPHSVSGVVSTEFNVNGVDYVVSGLSAAEVSKTDAGTYSVEVVGTAVVNEKESGKDVTDKFAVKGQNGTLTIKKRAITLRSKSLSKVADGTALTNGNNGLAETPEWAEGEGATYTFTGSQTKVGTSANSFGYKLNEGTKAKNYDITKIEGTLTVKSKEDAEHKIEVSANSATHRYDGTQKSVSGYTVSGLPNGYTLSGYITSGAVGTNAGTYENKISGTPKVINASGQDVTNEFEIIATSGTLKIDKLNVTIKSKDLVKEYDGTELVGTAKDLIITAWAPGEGAEYYFTGSQRLVGYSDNVFSVSMNSNTNPENYNLTKIYGTLEVTNREKPYEVEVKSNGATFEYDEQAHSVEGLVESTLTKVIGEHTFTITGLTAKGATRTEVGETANEIEGTAVVYDEFENDVTDQFKITLTPGILKITEKPAPEYVDASVTPVSTSKVYGNADPAFTATLTGVAEGESLAYTITRDSGEAPGTYTLRANGEEIQGNYKVTYGTGTLEIKKSSVDPKDPKPEDPTPDNPKPNDPRYDGVTTEAPQNATYNGQPQYQKPIVRDKNGKTLKENTDYKLVYDTKKYDYTNVTGTPVPVTVVGIGGYAGEYTVYYSIVPATLTIVTEGATKKYDGQPLTAAGYNVYGLQNKETVIVKTTGSQTEVGESNNTYSLTWDTAKASNYSVVPNYGKLVVTKGEESINPNDPTYNGVTVEGPSDSKYDGDEHKNKPVVKDKDGNILEEGKDYTLEYPNVDYTNAGEVSVIIRGIGKYCGELTVSFKINPRDVTLTSGSATKVFDGTPLRNNTVTVSGDGFLQGEGFIYKVTGQRTQVGTSANKFQYTINETYSNTKAQNYNVSVVFGTLTVTAAGNGDGGNGGNGGNGGGQVIRGIAGGDGQIVLQEIADEETPLANFFEDCCVLHLILLFMALCLFIYYMYDSKKRKGRIYDLEEELAKHGVIYW